MKYYLCARGYDCPPLFETLTAARQELREWVKHDKSKNRKIKLGFSKNEPDHKRLNIGGPQGYHIYSEYWIEKV